MSYDELTGMRAYQGRSSSNDRREICIIIVAACVKWPLNFQGYQRKIHVDLNTVFDW